MLKALAPPSYSRAAEILSRYRPIAPKPDTPLPSPSPATDASSASDGKIQQSPYLRNLWPQLQARPTRSRKRGRAPSVALSSSKRQRHTASAAHASVHPPCRFVCGLHHAGAPEGMGIRSLETLPLLPGLETNSALLPRVEYQEEDFVAAADEVPEEKDLLGQLQVTCTASHQNNDADPDCNNSAPVISPRPVRPVWSSIIVGHVTEYPAVEKPHPLPRKTVSEVEEEVESEALPAVISDSNGRVRLANSAYKEMVGQPECQWLDSVVVGGKSRRARISGEVILRLSEDAASMTELVEKPGVGFRCGVTIEWGNNVAGGRKTSVEAVCDVRRLWCESKNYVLHWRFHAAYRCR